MFRYRCIAISAVLYGGNSCRTNTNADHFFSQYSFADSSRVLSNATYFDGNATKYDWVVDSGNILNNTDGSLALTLTEANGGTRISSTHYVHYGTITARSASFLHVKFLRDTDCYAVKTGKWGGVVTAFITMSDVKDEIDWEFPGAQTTEGQSNFFWQGVISKF